MERRLTRKIDLDSAKNMSDEKAAKEKKPVQVRDATCERGKN